jgi:hypothetical protein
MASGLERVVRGLTPGMCRRIAHGGVGRDSWVGEASFLA